MKISKGIVLASIVASGSVAWGSGFSLYQPSTKAHAMGGAALGEALDASANVINPATLTDIKDITLTAGFVTEHPRARVRVDGATSRKMDPGAFMLPSVQFAMPLPKGFAFGIGFDAQYGLGSRYSPGWALDWNSRRTTVKGYCINPNIAYAINGKWSVGAGIRFLYFDFAQESNPMAVSDGAYYGKLNNRLKGDNNMHDLGWQVGTRYRVNDDFSVGALYRSKIDAQVEGHSHTSVNAYDFTAAERAARQYAAYGEAAVRSAYAAAEKMIIDRVGAGAAAANGPADARIELPQSVTFGFNWNVTPTVHLGAAASWSEWSSVDTLTFKLPNGNRHVKMRWDDTWRFSVAGAWDFLEDWSVMGSYVFDMDSTGSQESVMLPPADRHILTTGLCWRFNRNLEFALSYGIIIMDGGTMHTTDAMGVRHSMSVHRGLSHAAGFSVTYRF